MKSMKDFAAQQLSKKEMNNVKGGWSCLVVTKWGEGDGQNEGYYIEVPGNSADEAVRNVGHVNGAVGLVC